MKDVLGRHLFNSQLVITCGIEEKLPDELISILWRIIKCFLADSIAKREVDYLQVLDLSLGDNPGGLRVVHSQRRPSYSCSNTVYMSGKCDLAKLDGVRIFVIDDKTHVTMLLAEEY